MIKDPIIVGLASGWDHIDASTISKDIVIEADVVVVGTGAGGGTAAEILSQAGLKVVMLEAGPLKTSSDFDMEERTAYPNLYQQAASMKTADSAVGIFQGRAVGGSTTINWTTSIRTPDDTLKYWAAEKGLVGLSTESLTPWFEKAEQRLNIYPWQLPPNANNQMLAEGCDKLDWQYTLINRNVKGCLNLGYCGMGCPANAKQSMLVTTVPSALKNGAILISRAKAIQLEHSNGNVTQLNVAALDETLKPSGITMVIKAKRYVLAAGAIHTPTLLMRSKTPDPHSLLGKRTFLHPTLLSGAVFEQPINGHSGAPQSIYSDQFLWRNGVTGALGYKLEVPPIHPVLVSSKTLGYGESHAELMRDFNHLQVTIALIRDGFHNDSVGGQVQLTDTGFKLDYSLTNTFWYAAKHAFLSMAELQFAAGAKKVLPMNDGMDYLQNWSQAKQAINDMQLAPLKTIVASAHVMGGCPMGEDLTKAMIDSNGQHHYLENVSVMDGSMFPTSIGANPQLSIYGIVTRNASKLAESLKPI